MPNRKRRRDTINNMNPLYFEGHGPPFKVCSEGSNTSQRYRDFCGDTKDSQIVYLGIEIQVATDYSWARVIENAKT